MMNIYLVAAVVAACLLAYLIHALLNAEEL